MKYFAYGSNMSLLRLRQRVPSARRINTCILKKHSLRFHKVGKDGSGKCDAYETGKLADCVFGALFEINESEKLDLDKIEGLGIGYAEKCVEVEATSGDGYYKAMTYYAIQTESWLQPYSWYLNHVVVGAKEINVPAYYLNVILSTLSIKDKNSKRDTEQSSIHH